MTTAMENFRERVSSALRERWPEYGMEAWGLGTFMLSVAVFAGLLEHPGAWLHDSVTNPDARRALMGLAMGATAIGIIYSPWGKQSGAHLNPAVTLAFLALGKVRGVDAVFYIVAQLAGGLLGSLIGAHIMGAAFVDPPVSYAVTQPGEAGIRIAFGAELLISFLLMTMVLSVSNFPRTSRLTGVFAGMLIALFIFLEAPLSGMSMNPARSVASAAPAGIWTAIWIYLIAPPAGMLLAAQTVRFFRSAATVHCAKLDHAPNHRCIHCGYDPRLQYRHLTSRRLPQP